MVSALLLSLVVVGLPESLSAAAGCSGDEARPCDDNQVFKADGNGVSLKVYELGQGQKEAGNGAECDVREFWLLAGKSKPRHLMTLCNDGYGSAGIGEDDVKVKSNLLLHEQIGGAAERWVVTREIQLSPLELVAVTTTTFPSETQKFTDASRWSWATFSGERTRNLSYCTEEGGPDLREEAKPKGVRSALLPQVVVTKAYVEGGWKEAQLGQCAARAIFPLQGAEGAGDDGVLKVLALGPSEFIVEITDDVVGKGDQLQIWLYERGVNSLESCLGKQGVQASQWTVDPVTGEGRGGHNARFGAPKSELVRVGNQTRLHLRLPDGEWPGVTFAYTDSDDGKFIKRTMATSQFTFAQAATLGSVHPIDKKLALCEVENGVLTPRRTSTLPTKGPAFPGKAKSK